MKKRGCRKRRQKTNRRESQYELAVLNNPWDKIIGGKGSHNGQQSGVLRRPTGKEEKRKTSGETKRTEWSRRTKTPGGSNNVEKNAAKTIRKFTL